MDLNYKELNKKWEEDFYEDGWEPDTLKYTETENNIVEELKAFLPRHMPEYDWNLPYAEGILLIFRRHLKSQYGHENKLEALQEKLHKIKTWIEAYPLEVFPEPDFKKAHEVLQQHGMSLDAISASNMRHVLKGIKEIIEGA